MVPRIFPKEEIEKRSHNHTCAVCQLVYEVITGLQQTQTACSLVGFWAGLGWPVLVYCERKTLLAGWFGLAETNKRTG